jgi:Trk K+ transport system NAD-binding subunit
VDAPFDVAISPLFESERASAGHAIIVGDDRIVRAICERIVHFDGAGATLLGCRREDVADIVDDVVTKYVPGDPTESETLELAGIATARSILLLSEDDRLNLKVAMRARDLNPSIRIVMRQFNRALGRKIEARLANTSVVSLAAQSAAIFASATIDAANYYGVQFPDIDGPLFGFAQRAASDLDVVSATVAGLEGRLGIRILDVDGEIAQATTHVSRDAKLVTFGRVDARAPGTKRRPRRRPSPGRVFARIGRSWYRADPLARGLFVALFVVYALATATFVPLLQLDPISAAYYVLSTMTTTGYGDIIPHAGNHLQQLAAMLTMLSGVVLIGLFTAFVTANFTQARIRLQVGLRQIDSVGHYIVCGAGRVGSRVIDFLVGLGYEVVVVERSPTAAIVDRAREREFALLTGDATLDSTLEFCNVTEAAAIVALTENDTMNLEIMLGAQLIAPNVPSVMRVLEGDFAASIARHFGTGRTFGAADLVSPVLAGLSYSPDVRGFLEVAGREYGVSQLEATPENVRQFEATPGAIVLACASGGAVRTISDCTSVAVGDLLLFLYPAYRHRREGRLADRDGIA